MARVRIMGVDSEGALPGGAARPFTAAALDSGAVGLQGTLGDGAGQVAAGRGVGQAHHEPVNGAEGARRRLTPLDRLGAAGHHPRPLGLAEARPVAATAGRTGPNGNQSLPTPALRGGLCGEFVDFGLMPELLAQLDPNRPAAHWADLLEERGFDSRHIDPDDGRSAAAVAAEGAWRMANRLGLVRNGQVTEAGEAVAALAGIDAEARQEALAPLLRPGVESALAGQGGKPIIPLLERAAQSLAESTNLWVRILPALMPVELGAIVHWACIDFRHAESLVKDIEINRNVAMHRGGVPNPEVSVEAKRDRHFERVMEFYMDQPGPGGRVPFSFGEELAMAKIIGFCELLREIELAPGFPCLG